MKAEFTNMDSPKSSSLVPPRRTSARKAQKRSLETPSDIPPPEAENIVAVENLKSPSEPLKKRRRIPTIKKLESEILNQLSTKEKGRKPATPRSDVDTPRQLVGKKTRDQKPTVSQLESEIIEQLSKNKLSHRNNESEASAIISSPALVLDTPSKNGSQIDREMKEQPLGELGEVLFCEVSRAKKRGRKPKSIEDYLHLTPNVNSNTNKRATGENLDVSVSLKKLTLVSLIL